MTTYKTGADTIIALKKSATFGTAVTVASGDKLEVESLSQSKNPQELTANPIGSGNSMANDAQQGATAPSIDFEALMHYDAAEIAALAVFMGSDSAMSMGSGAYVHSIIHNTTFNAQYLTCALQADSADVMEFPTCVVNSVELSAAEPPCYLKGAFKMLANDRVISGTTNAYGDVGAATVANSTRIVPQPSDEFLINAQAGSALASPGDRLNVRSLTLTLNKEQAFQKEFKGASGNGSPIPTGSPPFSGELALELKSLSDLTYFTAADAGTEYKASFTVTGSLIGGSVYRKFVINIPRMKLIQDPKYDLTSTSVNPLQLTFKFLVASSNPTGMISTYPYFMVWNTKATAYTA
jgi:hypothetical protein